MSRPTILRTYAFARKLRPTETAPAGGWHIVGTFHTRRAAEAHRTRLAEADSECGPSVELHVPTHEDAKPSRCARRRDPRPAFAPHLREKMRSSVRCELEAGHRGPHRAAVAYREPYATRADSATLAWGKR